MNRDDFDIEAAREAFRTRERLGIRLEIFEPGIVLAYHDGVLLWQSVALDGGSADQVIWSMVHAITHAATELTIMRAHERASSLMQSAEARE